MSNRECEVKIICLANTCQALAKELTHRFGPPYEATGRDYFYRSRGKAEFLRLREVGDGKGLLCSKTNDAGTIADREELEVLVEDFNLARRVLDRTHTAPGALVKTYRIWWDSDIVYSLYVVDKDPLHVFFEIEAPTVSSVQHYYNNLLGYLPYHKVCTQSLYKMYYGGGHVPRLAL